LLFARFSAYSLAQKKGYFFPTGINIEKLVKFVKGGGENFGFFWPFGVFGGFLGGFWLFVGDCNYIYGKLRAR